MLEFYLSYISTFRILLNYSLSLVDLNILISFLVIAGGRPLRYLQENGGRSIVDGAKQLSANPQHSSLLTRSLLRFFRRLRSAAGRRTFFFSMSVLCHSKRFVFV